ncbi:hypothetical protein [Paraburkholderia sp. J41]|uniref:hypothetical protein n=1 Tax=Paraburkholderia sp. J41 TaxID=2805433 RepID=UPI002AC31934|nr:hypothetical protein [Paraburkholderia sp. J41]
MRRRFAAESPSTGGHFQRQQPAFGKQRDRLDDQHGEHRIGGKEQGEHEFVSPDRRTALRNQHGERRQRGRAETERPKQGRKQKQTKAVFRSLIAKKLPGVSAWHPLTFAERKIVGRIML